MKKEFKLQYEKDTGVVRILGGGWGVVYVIVKGKIALKDAIPYEANEKGRCIGFEVGKRIDLDSFHIRIREFAKEYDIEIIE